jgi:hypothetical protein
MSTFTDQLQQMGIVPDQQPAQPAPGGNWRADLDRLGPAPSGGDGSFLDQLNQLGIKPQPSPMTSDWQRDLDRLGPAPAATPPSPAPVTPQQPAPDTDWSALPSHILPSAGQFIGNVAHAVAHPVASLENVADIGMGALQMLGVQGGDEYKPYAQAFGKMLSDRYGSVDAVRQTMINDPVGFAADASALFGGAGLAARSAGMAGAADVASQAARLTNPLTAAAVPLRLAGRGAAEVIGVGTGTGARPLEEAAAAGFEGGSRAKAFRGAITGRDPMEAPVEDAQRAIDHLVSDQKSKYMQDMAELGLNTKQLSLADTYQAVQGSKYIGGFGQTMSANPVTQATWNAVDSMVQQWALDGARNPTYLTPIGLDGLKRQIGKLGPYSGESGAIITQVQKAIRGTISREAPEYIPYMQKFEEAQRLIDQLRKTFSMPAVERKINMDTALRKLQSLMRDNVNTSYGYRGKLAEYLTDEAPDLTARLAGQALNPIMARGLSRLAMQLGTEAGAAMLGIGGLSGGALGMAALAPFMSPRLMGNAAYRLGQMGRAGAYGPAAFQFGRADQGVQ